jgi:hypothetical protein
MQRLSTMLTAVALAAAPGCQKKKSGEPEKQAGAPANEAAAAPLGLEEMQALLPDQLAGLPRQLVAPEPEIPQVSAYYQDPGNTRSGHVVYTILSDPARTRKHYDGRFPERAQVGSRSLWARTWQPKSQPETAEGCLILGDAVSACIDVAPGKVADLAPLFEALPLADLEKRAARR